MWAYQTMIVREARRCGGKEWQAYDIMFRQQVVNNPTADRSVLNSSLHSTTKLGRTCLYCLETDHASDKCALAPTQPPNAEQGHNKGPDCDDRIQGWERTGNRGTCFAWNDGKCTRPYCRFNHVCATCGSGHRE